MARLQFSPVEKFFPLILQHIQDEDKRVGNDLLKRFLDGPQAFYDQMFAIIENLRDLNDVDLVAVNELKLLKNTVSIPDDWTEALSDAELRKLVRLAAAHWKLKSTQGGLVNIIRSILNIVPVYRDYFFYEWALDEQAISEEAYVSADDGIIDLFMHDQTLVAESFFFNFAPTAHAGISGYTTDDGSVYTAAKGHGWDTDISGNTRDRALQRDERLDTMIFATAGEQREWKVDITNGWYEVTLAVGDAGFPQTKQMVIVQEETVLTGVSRSTNEFIMIRRIVKVTDGSLRVKIGDPSAVAGGETVVCYIHVLKRLEQGLVNGAIREHEPATNTIVATFAELFDDFDDQTFTDDNWEIVGGGNPTLSGGKMTIANNQGIETTVPGDDSWVNYLLSLRTVKFTAMNRAASEAFKIIFYQDLDNEDSLRIKFFTDTDEVRLEKGLNSVFSTLASATFKVSQDVDYVMTITVQNDPREGEEHEVVLTIDETEIIRHAFTEIEIHSGSVALRIDGFGTLTADIGEVKVVPLKYEHLG